MTRRKGSAVRRPWMSRLLPSRTIDERERHIAAQKLLHGLIDVSRRLSTGLDPVALSYRLLHDCLEPVGATGELLVRTDGGVFETLARFGGDVPEDLGASPVVRACWEEARLAEPAADDMNADGVTCALPLRIGSRMIGVVVVIAAASLDGRMLRDAQSVLDDGALPLDTALLFDEVRRMATTEERHRLAREIHDGVAQEIASLGYLVDDIGYASDDVRPARLKELRNGLTRVVDDLRLSIFELRSEVSRNTGLGLVLSEYLRELGVRSTIAVHLAIDETPERLRPAVEEESLRIVQEAVTNARKHSGAENIWVTCTVRPPSVELVIEDDGRGIDVGSTPTGFGLSIMRERAARMGASLTLEPRPGGGTRVRVATSSSDGTEVPGSHVPASSWHDELFNDTSEVVAHG